MGNRRLRPLALAPIIDSPEWKKFEQEDLLANAPIVARYVPDSGTADQRDKWVYESGLRAGYELCLNRMGVALDE